MQPKILLFGLVLCDIISFHFETIQIAINVSQNSSETAALLTKIPETTAAENGKGEREKVL